MVRACLGDVVGLRYIRSGNAFYKSVVILLLTGRAKGAEGRM